MEPTIKILYDNIEKQTDKAVLYKIAGEKVWMPISQIIRDDLTANTVEITEWIAKQKGLEEEGI